MPEASKNIAIGSLIAIALTLVLWVLLFLHPSFGDGKFHLHVRFVDIEKIGVGTRVTYAGRPIGQVTKITPVPENERLASPNSETIYSYDLKLAVDSHIPLYTSDEITIGTSGLMGERFISIIPRMPQKVGPVLLTNDNVVYATKAGSVDDAFEQISRVAMKAEETIDILGNLVRDNRHEVESTVKSIQSAALELNTLLTKSNESGLVTSLASASAQFERTMNAAEAEIAKLRDTQLIGKLGSTLSHLDSIASSLDNPEQLKSVLTATNDLALQMKETSAKLSNSWPKIEQAVDAIASAAESAKTASVNANHTVATIENVVAQVASGQGSIGRLLVSDDFYFKTVAIMNKADTLMNDFNHYGVLFHLDKGWQRDRRKRIEELARLQNPQEFKTFLNEEMFKISTAISRLGMALEKAENAADSKAPIVAQGEFARTFNELLAQVRDLEASLKDYSVEIADRQNQPTNDDIAQEN